MLLLLTACAPSEDAFPSRYAASVCARQEACATEEFAAHYRDREECVDAQEAWAETYARCDYVEEGAGACLAALDDPDCDAFAAAAATCTGTYEGCAFAITYPE